MEEIDEKTEEESRSKNVERKRVYKSRVERGRGEVEGKSKRGEMKSEERDS